MRRVEVDGFWIDAPPRDRGGVPPLREGDRPRHGGRAPARSRPTIPDADPELLVPGSLVFQPDARAGGPRRLPQLVGVRSRAPTGAHRRARAAPSTAASGIRSPTSPTRTPRRTPSGPARRCRPRRSGSTRRAAGSKAPPTPGATSSRPTGRMMANTWQGEFPWQNLLLDGYGARPRSAPSRPTATGCTTWPATSGSGRATTSRCPRRCRPSCCAPRNPRESQPPRRSGRRNDPASRDQGRLAPLRPELLPALPPGRAPGRDGRHVDRHIGFRCVVRPSGRS